MWKFLIQYFFDFEFWLRVVGKIVGEMKKGFENK